MYVGDYALSVTALECMLNITPTLFAGWMFSKAFEYSVLLLLFHSATFSVLLNDVMNNYCIHTVFRQISLFNELDDCWTFEAVVSRAVT